MNRIGEWIRSKPALRQFTRDLRMFYRRRRYGLRHIHRPFFVNRPLGIEKDFVAGPYGLIGDGAWICPRVTFGKYVLVAPKLAILGGDHRFDIPGTPIMYSGRPEVPPTVIEDDVWIGYRVTIMAGVRVGRGAVIAAGSVVTKDVDPYTVVAGVPAKPVRKRFEDPADIEAHARMLAEPARPGRYVMPKEIDKPPAGPSRTI